MPRCKHELVPLVERPTDTTGRIDYLFCPVADYVVCRHCGRVGWYARYSRRLRFVTPEAQASILRQAQEWKREPHQHARLDGDRNENEQG